jgi:hypothetical protein
MSAASEARRRWNIIEALAAGGPDAIDRALRHIQHCWGIDDGTLVMVLDDPASDTAPGFGGHRRTRLALISPPPAPPDDGEDF